MEKPTAETIEGKRVAAFDYGGKRIGFAVCDALHISISPRGHFDNGPDAMKHIIAALQAEEVGAVVVGMPYRTDGARSPIMERIDRFVKNLREKTNLPVFISDEAFSSKQAFQLMIEANHKKKTRRQSGKKDEVAAAIILREFLRELE